MGNGDSFDKFRDYLKNVRDPEQDRCWFCQKTPDEIRMEFFEYMKDPDKEFEDLGLDDLIIMSYKLKKPVCAGCYFAIKNNEDMVKEILESREEDVWEN